MTLFSTHDNIHLKLVDEPGPFSFILFGHHSTSLVLASANLNIIRAKAQWKHSIMCQRPVVTCGHLGRLLAPDNNIYYMPYRAHRIMRLNPDNDTLSSVGDGLGRGWFKYRGSATMVGNEMIFACTASLMQPKALSKLTRPSLPQHLL